MNSKPPTFAPLDGRFEDPALLEHLYSIVPAGLCLLDPALRYLRVNAIWTRLSGLTEATHIGRSVEEVSPETAALMLPALQRVQATREPAQALEFSSGISDAGEERHWLVSFHPLLSNEGELTAIRGVAQDVTEQKQAELALLESKSHYRDVVDNIQGMICTHDLHGRILSVNPATASLLGYTTEELIGMNLADLLAPSVRSELEGFLKRIEQLGVDSGYMKTLSKDGEERVWTYRNVLRRREGSEPYVIGLAIDISDQLRAEKALRRALDLLETRVADRTQDLAAANAALRGEIEERQKAQEALRASEEAMRQLLETTNVIPWLADADTWLFTYVGPQAVKLLGYPIEQWYEQDFWAPHIHPDDREAALAFCIEQSQTTDHYEFEYRMIAADGRVVWIHDIVSVESSEGRPAGLRGFMIDVTSRKQAQEEELLLSERMARVAHLTSMGEMAAGIAHEISQPLTAIATYGQACERLIRASSASEDQVLGTVRQIVEEALRAGDIIHRLKNLLRSRPGRRSLCQVNELISEVARLAIADPTWKDFDLRFDLGDDLPPVVADGVQIQQVILNLIRNAQEASARQERTSGSVIVKTELDGASGVRVSVVDHGVGVRPDIESKLFQPFFTTKESGMGLGLSLSGSIIESHAGRLWFTHNQEGGATFHFTLPPTTDSESTATS